MVLEERPPCLRASRLRSGSHPVFVHGALGVVNTKIRPQDASDAFRAVLWMLGGDPPNEVNVLLRDSGPADLRLPC